MLWIIVIYLCIHGKCNHWDYITTTRDAQLFKLWRACCLYHTSISFTLAWHKLSTTAKCKSYGFQKTLASRKAHAAVSNETANTQTSSDGEQNETILVCSSCSLSTTAEVPDIFVTNKGHKRKRLVSESEADEVLMSTATEKSCKKKKWNPKFRTVQTPSN